MFTRLSVALVGSLAVATQAHYAHQKHQTSKALGGYGNQTTSATPSPSSFDNSPTGVEGSVVYETVIATVTSCESTVKDCPATTAPYVTTSVVPVHPTSSSAAVSSGSDEHPSSAQESSSTLDAAPSSSHPVDDTSSSYEAMPTSSHPAAGNGTASTTPVSSGFDNSPTGASQSVIYETVIATVTSCESTVKDCPATTAPYVVTSVVTVVPTSSGDAMPSASHPVESNVDSASPSVPLTTGGASSIDNSPVVTGDHTLTYTQGAGSSTTVITTTIKMTSTQTNTNTIYATSSGADSAPTGGSEDGPKGGDEPTTTITNTKTMTQTKTVIPAVSGPATTGSDNSPIGAGASGSGASKCPVPTTVTVTGAPVTVTVTASSAPASSGSDNSPETTGLPDISSVPYPISSGSATTKKSKKPCPTASTGFITKPYPSFTAHPSATITFEHPQTTGVGYM
ncbi:MAG: hypothetical protein Q9174_005427 [Haloplaca sp. 1 TL-2023]